jgi:spore germination protein YaaH
MKKSIPVITAIVLIIIIIGVSFGKNIYDRYSHTKERKDMNEYFSIMYEGQVPVILQDEKSDYNAKLIDGIVYFDFDTMHELLNKRFYYDSNEMILLYALPDKVVNIPLESSSYKIGTESASKDYTICRKVDDKIYVAVDFIADYSDFDYTFYSDPNYIQIYKEWEQVEVATLKRDTELRYQGGVKSEILEDLTAGSTVVILERMDTWTKVKSESSLIGYIENKYIENESTYQRVKENQYVEPVYASISLDDPICLGWHAIGGKSGNSTISEVLKDDSPMNVISPTWFHLTDNDGNFESYATESYVEYAHARDVQVWALISGIEFRETNNLDSFELLSYTSKRTYLIDNLIAEVLAYNIDGINLDFENITQESSEPYIQFVRELSIACRANGIVLSIDNYVPKAYNMFYDRTEQGIFADYVVIMGYDEHTKNGGEVGSVASFDFVSEGITETLKEVPAEKVINGMPFYTVRWEITGGEITGGNIGMEEAESFVSRNGLETVWDDVVEQNYASYETDTTKYEIWLEDEDSIRVRLNLANLHELAGVAVWRLGFEKPEVWDVFREYLGTEVTE